MDSTNIKTSSQTSPQTNGPSKSGHLYPGQIQLKELRKVPESLVECNLQLLESKEFADVTLVLGKREQKSIECHQLFLKARSTVFEIMFKRRWNNNSNEELMSIEIPDIEPETFEHFLQFVYADVFKIETIPEAIELLYVAHKYQVKGLVKRCEVLLKAQIKVEEAVKIYKAACRYDLKHLQDDAIQVMTRHFQSLTQHSSFLEADERTLEALLHRHDIMTEEIEIFNAVFMWATNKISQQKQTTDELRPEQFRSMLENLIPLIRFPLMTIKQFSTFVVPTKILLDQEMIDIFMYFGGGKSESDLKKCSFPSTSDGMSISMNLYEPLTLAPNVYVLAHQTTNHEETLTFSWTKIAPRSGFRMNSLVLRGPSNNFQNGSSYTKNTLPQKVETSTEVTVSVRTSSTNIWTTSGDSIIVAKNISISSTQDTVINMEPIVLKNYVWITTTFNSTMTLAHDHPNYHDVSGPSRLNINDFVQLKVAHSEQQNENMLKIQDMSLIPSTGGSETTSSMFTPNNISYNGYEYNDCYEFYNGYEYYSQPVSQCSASCLAHVVRSIGLSHI